MVVRRLLAKPWDIDDVSRLKELANSGASVLRAAAALGRPAKSVQRKANDLGISLAGVRQLKAELRAKRATEDRRRS